MHKALLHMHNLQSKMQLITAVKIWNQHKASSSQQYKPEQNSSKEKKSSKSSKNITIKVYYLFGHFNREGLNLL